MNKSKKSCVEVKATLSFCQFMYVENFFFSVDIFCDVISGPFVVSSNGGNGHKGQEGGRGAVGRDSGDTVR